MKAVRSAKWVVRTASSDKIKSEEKPMNKILRILGKRGRITIPYEIRQRLGVNQNDVLSFTESSDGRTVIIRREKLCECDKRERSVEKEAKEEVTLYEFLNNLTPEQQRAALIHLSVKWAEKQGEEYAAARV